jgi:hypothetical protein
LRARYYSHMIQRTVFILFLISFVYSGCRHTPLLKPEPCDKKPLWAILHTQQMIEANKILDGVTEKYFDSDTFFANEWVYFRAEGNFKYCFWKIGTDPRVFRDKVFRLYFREPTVATVELSYGLYVEDSCISTKRLSDTIRKKIVVIPGLFDTTLKDYPQYPLCGRFSGFNIDNPNDTFTVTIGFYKMDGVPDKYKRAAIENLPKGNPPWPDIEFRYLNFSFGSPGHQAYGWGYLDATRQKLTVDYDIPDAQGNRIRKKFIGSRR